MKTAIRGIGCDSWLFGVSLAALVAGTGVANAQTKAPSPAAEKPAADPAADSAQDDDIVVTGYAASLAKSLDEKRSSNSMIDVINAEDIGKFPESNLAEALQRLPGITIERENGEGRKITVRGLGGDFVRTRLNGVETVASAGNNEGQTSIDRTRGFDYNVFATELFTRLSVQKSAEASVDEGSLGSNIDINTGRPLSFKKNVTVVLSVQDNYYKNDKKNNPRIAGMLAGKFFNGTLGLMVSGAYQKRDTGISFYDRQDTQVDFNYRGSDLAGPVRNGTGGTFTPTCVTSDTAPVVDATHNSSPLNCFWGFATAAPTVTTAAPSGIGRTAFGIDSNSFMFGSNPAAAALFDANPGAVIPGLSTIQQQRLKQERLGLTAGLEWKPTSKTRVTVNGLFARFNVDNDSALLGPFGLNRHFDNARAEIGLTNTSTGLRPWSAANFNYFADRRAAYGNSCNTSTTLNCSGALGNPSVAVLPTAQYWNGTSYISVPSVLNSNTWSTNPYNLDTYDYYNNPNSVGYNPAAAAADRRGILMYDQLVGHEHTIVSDAHINNAGQIDYLKLDRVDWLTNDAYAQNRTRFFQIDGTIEQEFTSRLKGQFTYGRSSSTLKIDGGRTDVFGLDKNGFVYDERNGGSMPIWNPGFDVSDPTQFSGGELVKGYASVARYVNSSENKYQTFRGDMQWRVSDALELAFGVSKRNYDFTTQRVEVTRSVLPTIAELNKYGRDKGLSNYANLTLADLGRVVSFGSGLDLPAGVPTSWWSPDRKKFDQILGYNCNCVNDFADWRLGTTNGSTLFVSERDLSGYLQANYNLELFGQPLRGNVGMRVARTRVNSASIGTAGNFNGITLAGSNEYVDWLPSINVVYEPIRNLLVRFAASKSMARPQLGNLAPGVTSLSFGTTPDIGNPPRLTLGNPKLEPFRSKNIDLNLEWYFARNSLLSIALFYKKLDDYPRQQTFLVKLDEFLPPELFDRIKQLASTNTAQADYLNGANIWNVTSYIDSPGGWVRGFEVQLQHRLTFLPKPFDGFGVQANVTHVESELAYLTQAGVWAKAPWPFASPWGVNATLYYERGPFDARISYNWRDRFASKFPQTQGTCPPGLLTGLNGGVCTSPFTDFVGTEATSYVDVKASYALNGNLKFDFSVQNLLGATESQWLYENNLRRKYSAGSGPIITAGLRVTF